MKINSTKLKDALKPCIPATSGRTTIPVLNCVRIAAANGRATFCATNLDYEASSVAECDGELEPVCVPAKTLGALVSAEQGETTLEKAGGRLKVASSFAAALAIIDADEYPAFCKDNFKSLAINADDLANGIESAMWAAAVEQPAFPERQCVRVRANGMLSCDAFDGKSFSRHQTETICEACEFLVPSAWRELVVALRGQNPIIEVSASFFRVRHDAGAITVKLADLKFPNIEPFLKDLKLVGECSKEELVKLAAACAPLFEPDKPQYWGATLVFEQGGIDFRYASNIGEIETRMLGKFLPMTIRLNPRLLLECLNHVRADSLYIYTDSLEEPRAIHFKTDRQSIALAGLVG